MPKAEVAAPAVHVDQWKHWSMREGMQRTRRTCPQGCAVVVDGDELYYQEMSNGREFALQPLSPDAQAWFDANRDDLRGGKNWRRRRTEALTSSKQPAAPRAGAYTFSGHLYDNQMGFDPPRVNYMACFLGAVSQVSTTNNVELSIWPGLQPADASTVLQPQLIRRRPGPTNAWVMHNGINHQGTEINVGEAPIQMPQGVWGVIREYGGTTPYWMVGFFRGTRGNTGPAFGRPVPGMIPLNVLFKDPRWSVDITRFRWQAAIVSIEIPDADGTNGWNCSDITIQAVFGGLTVNSLNSATQVAWFQQPNLAAGAGVGCPFSQAVTNSTTNGQAQVSAEYSS